MEQNRKKITRCPYKTFCHETYGCGRSLYRWNFLDIVSLYLECTDRRSLNVLQGKHTGLISNLNFRIRLYYFMVKDHDMQSNDRIA